jgi:nitrate/TMAO reductase-like tetraheme cytochrome c subunit
MSVGKKLLSKLPKYDLSKTEDRLKLIVLLGGIILVFGALGVGGLAFTMRSEFCSSCHEMAPEYKTWQASTHSQIGCTDCHIEPGVINLMKDKMGAMVQVYKHVTVSYESPIEYPVEHKGKIKNVICLKCHSGNRQYSPSGDILVPHDKHIAQGVNCVDCHSGVAHGNVAEREVSKASNIPFEQWTSTVGQQQMIPKFARPRMDTCVKCHMERGQTTNCTKCHSEMGIPSTHKDQVGWKVSHGVTARPDVQACDKCHSYGFVEPIGDKKLPVGEYARDNEFCLDCHTKRPTNHGNKEDENWISSHKDVVKAKGIENCLACHDTKPGAKPATTAATAEGAKKENTGDINRMVNSDRDKSSMVNKVFCSNCHAKNRF